MPQLNIPLTENPTRQKIWRVVVFVAPLFLAASLSMLAVRAYITVDTLSSMAPSNTVMTLRVIKTPATSAVLEDKFHGVLLFPDAPFAVNELSSWSKRGSAIFINDTGVVGVAVAGKVPQSKLDEAKALGLSISHSFGGTYIGTEPAGSTSFLPKLPVLTLLPWFNGEVLAPQLTHKSAPARLSTDSLTITGLGRSSTSIGTSIDQSLAKISVSPDEAQNLLGFDIPLVFPGLNTLEKQMMTHGFSLTLGQDDEGTPYSIAVESGTLSKESMENAVSELYYTKTLVNIVTEDNYTELNEIVSTSNAKPATTSDLNATITSISDNSGAIVRATQTSHGLVVTNRAVSIAGQVESAAMKNSCLSRANQWIAIDKLYGLFPVRLSTPGWTIMQKLLESKEIAFSNRRTRICW